MTRLKLAEIAARIDAHLKRFAADPELNVAGPWFDLPAASRNGGNRVAVVLRRRTNAIQCQEPNCTNRAKKIRHPNNGALYGTLCAFHRAQHRRELARDYERDAEALVRYGEEKTP